MVTVAEKGERGNRSSRTEDTVELLKKRNYKIIVTMFAHKTTIYPVRAVLDKVPVPTLINKTFLRLEWTR